MGDKHGLMLTEQSAVRAATGAWVFSYYRTIPCDLKQKYTVKAKVRLMGLIFHFSTQLVILCPAKVVGLPAIITTPLLPQGPSLPGPWMTTALPGVHRPPLSPLPPPVASSQISPGGGAVSA